MTLHKEELTQEFYRLDFYLARHQGSLKSAILLHGLDSSEAEKWRLQVRVTKDAMIDVGGQIGRLPRGR